MCCIGGWYCWSDKRPAPQVIEGMLLAGRTRGQDAAGLAWRDSSGQIKIIKERGDAKDFVKKIDEPMWAEITGSRIGLLHNRAKTKGTEWKTENNHPVSAFGWVVVHNGTLQNDDDVFAYHGIERPAEVDTVAINMLLSRQKDYLSSFRELTVTSGGLTAAMWKVDEPDNLGIIRLGPNELFLWEQEKILYWSSSPVAGQALPYKALGSLVFQNTAFMPEDRLLVLTPEKARTFALTRNPFLPPRKVVPYTPPTGWTKTPEKSAIPAGTTSQESAGLDSDPSPSTGSASETTTTSFAKPTFSWKGPGRVGKFVKPPPMFEEMAPEFYNLFEIMTRVRDAEPPYCAIRTGYGTWHFHREPSTLKDGEFYVARDFSPAKRQKTLFEIVFGEVYKKLPIHREAVDAFSPDDGKLVLEEFVTKMKMGTTGALLQKMGYMCPVCGITLRTAEWEQNLMRCKFCGIRSEVGAQNA